MYVAMLDDTRLWVQESGDENPVATILFAHGWTLDHRSALALFVSVQAQSAVPVRLVTYDNRGHGRSDRAQPESATLDQFADDIAELVGRYDRSGPVVVVGHSLGGMAMCALADRHPDLFPTSVGAAAFVATTAGPFLRFGTNKLLELGALVGVPVLMGTMGRLPRAWHAAAVRGIFGRAVPQGGPRLVASQQARANPVDLGRFARDALGHERLDRLGPYATIPVAVLGGTRDMLTPTFHQRRLVRAIPGARLVVYGSAGHQLPQERTDAVAQVLIDLVEQALDAAAARSA